MGASGSQPKPVAWGSRCDRRGREETIVVMEKCQADTFITIYMLHMSHYLFPKCSSRSCPMPSAPRCDVPLPKTRIRPRARWSGFATTPQRFRTLLTRARGKLYYSLLVLRFSVYFRRWPGGGDGWVKVDKTMEGRSEVLQSSSRAATNMYNVLQLTKYIYYE